MNSEDLNETEILGKRIFEALVVSFQRAHKILPDCERKLFQLSVCQVGSRNDVFDAKSDIYDGHSSAASY